MKILVIGPSWVGDMMMSQSLYRTLRARYPQAIIDVMAPAWCRPLLSRMPEVNEAIPMPLGHGALEIGERRKLGHSLRERRYDRAYVLPNSFKSALVPFFAGIPVSFSSTFQISSKVTSVDWSLCSRSFRACFSA